VEAELSKLSLDKESRVLAEMERISAERQRQTASQCDELSLTVQQDIGQLTELTRQSHRDSVTQLKSASEHLLREVLGSIETMSVLLVYSIMQ